ncbi:hypothetical protein MEX01_18890 [Methylorubrum extorquens]|nr:hypothetical protein MEX01_18890 [Methylorubrum extorquens]
MVSVMPIVPTAPGEPLSMSMVTSVMRLGLHTDGTRGIRLREGPDGERVLEGRGLRARTGSWR